MPAERRSCPLCGYEGTDDQMDDHRATGVHNDQPQAGGNVRHRTRLASQRHPSS